MLHSISWQQYVTALFLLTAAWYTWVSLTYYRNELRALLRFKTVKTLPLVASAPLRTVMGGVQTDQGHQSFDAEELLFGPAESDDLSEATFPKGPSDDLLAEAQALISAFIDGGTKSDFLSLLQLLLDKYEIYREEINLNDFRAVLLPLTRQLPFELTEKELDLHWPAENQA